jgi:hypothetical protein
MKPLQMPLIGGEQELLRSGVSVRLIAWLVGQMPTGGSDGRTCDGRVRRRLVRTDDGIC